MTPQAAPTGDAGSLRYCYHCRKHHPAGEMRRIETRGGFRWRSVHSIAAARQAADVRQAYGRQTTNANRQENQRRMAYVNAMRRAPVAVSGV